MNSPWVSCEGADPSHRPPYEVGANPYIGPSESVVACVAAVACGILGVLSNIVSIVVFTSNERLKGHSTTPFLLSLAVSDLIFSAFNMPLLALSYFYREWTFGYGTCELFPIFYNSNIFVSTFSMAFISLNRFIGIFYPEKLFKIFTPFSCVGMIIGTWIMSVGLMLLPLLELWGHLGYEPKTFSCTILPRNDKSPMNFFLVLTFGLPCVLIVLFYALIYWKVKQIGNEVRRAMKSSRDKVNSISTDFEAKARQRERQLTKTFTVICAGYILCFLPKLFLDVVDPMPPCYGFPKLHVAGEILFMTSAFLNPFCYTITNKAYRAAYLKVIRSLACWKGRTSEGSSSVSAPNVLLPNPVISSSSSR